MSSATYDCGARLKVRLKAWRRTERAVAERRLRVRAARAQDLEARIATARALLIRALDPAEPIDAPHREHARLRAGAREALDVLLRPLG